MNWSVMHCSRVMRNVVADSSAVRNNAAVKWNRGMTSAACVNRPRVRRAPVAGSDVCRMHGMTAPARVPSAHRMAAPVSATPMATAATPMATPMTAAMTAAMLRVDLGNGQDAGNENRRCDSAHPSAGSIASLGPRDHLCLGIH